MESNSSSVFKKIQNPLSLKAVIFWFLILMIIFIAGFFSALNFFEIYPYETEMSALSDTLHAILGLPIAIVGTLLAFYLALTAYNLSKSESNRDKLSLFHSKVGKSSQLFTLLSVRLGRLLQFSESTVTPFKRMYAQVYDADYMNAVDYQNIDLSEGYEKFFNDIKYELNRVGFVSELRALEDEIVELLAEPVTSKILNSKLEATSLSSILKAVRGWGNIVAGSNKKSINSRYGEDLYGHLFSEQLQEFYYFNQKPENPSESDYLLDRSQMGDAVIDTKAFAFIFFGSLLDAREIESEGLSQAYFDNIKKPEEGYTLEQTISIEQEHALRSRMRKRFEINEGLVMLKELINAIPDSGEIIDSYAKTIGLDPSLLEDSREVGVNPKVVLEPEQERLENLLNQPDCDVKPKRLLGMQSDFQPVSYHRLIFQ